MLAGAKDSESRDRGQTIIVVGLFIQLIFFGIFVVVALVFHRRIHNEPTSASLKIRSPWKKLLVALYVSSALIMVRSVFRVAEYITGEDGVLMSNEAYIYVFDATLMLIVTAMFNVFHPSAILSKENMQRVYNPDSENQFEFLG